MARRKRHTGESVIEVDDEESAFSPSILGIMLSLDEELYGGGRKSTKSPRKSHIPIYDPESSPTKSPRPPKRKAYPPKEEPIEPSILHLDSMFVSTPDEIPTKPAPVRLGFPNHVTGSPPPHLTSVAKGSPRKAPHAAGGYSSIHKPAETNSSTINVDTTPLSSHVRINQELNLPLPWRQAAC
ncbi:hypothetical protein DYB31_015707 [Aphanomyces astaci]|uniref:Uncharacterized protein n=1 Tax=Aphanomyces astaci TaxID=112090 RepID=A0A397FWA5_APHAT|nr:hypothetical protein DYB31_015707 [Aphanomyces astaci]